MSMNEKKRQQKLAENLAKTTRFSRSQIDMLIKKHQELCKSSHGSQHRLDRTAFREFLHKTLDITDDMIMDRIFKVFDCKNDGSVNAESWVRCMSRYLGGTMDEKAKFAFEVYDLSSDGYLTREKMYNLLKSALTKLSVSADDDPEEGVKDLVEIVLKKLDKDSDARVSQEDFIQAVMEEDLLSEVLGKVFPTEELAAIFLEQHNTYCSCSGQQETV